MQASNSNAWAIIAWGSLAGVSSLYCDPLCKRIYSRDVRMIGVTHRSPSCFRSQSTIASDGSNLVTSLSTLASTRYLISHPWIRMAEAETNRLRDRTAASPPNSHWLRRAVALTGTARLRVVPAQTADPAESDPAPTTQPKVQFDLCWKPSFSYALNAVLSEGIQDANRSSPRQQIWQE